MHPITSPIAWATGIPEPTLRLLVTLILAYPVARFYNHTYVNVNGSKFKSTANDRNTFVLVSGLSLSFFFNGWHIYHSLLTVALSYACCYVGENMGNRLISCGGVWLLNATYLLGGYYFTATDDYDITWTMTQCILCLRLMGFGFDMLDGARVKKSSKTAQTNGAPKEVSKPAAALPHSFSTDTPLETLPPFEEVLAYCFFPSAFLVGPQFSFSLYKRWLSGPFNGEMVTDMEETKKAQMLYVWRSVLLAVAYLGVQQIIGGYFPTSYLLTDEYAQLPLIQRMFIFIMTGRFVYSKYFGVWLLTEGASAYFGISYEGEDSEHLPKFGGLANIAPSVFETGTSIDHAIASFNINTNYWVKYYVFKRLRFLGNKLLSQVFSLGFLAIWHGFHAAYFVTFFNEFACTFCESIIRKRFVVPHVYPRTLKNPIAHQAWKTVAWIVYSCSLYYCIIGFDLLKFHKTWVAYKQVYFVGHFIFFFFFALSFAQPKTRSRPVHLKSS